MIFVYIIVALLFVSIDLQMINKTLGFCFLVFLQKTIETTERRNLKTCAE